MAKYPYKACIKTEHGGFTFKRARNLESACNMVIDYPEPRSLKGKTIAIVRRYVTNTRDEVVLEFPAC